MSVTLLLIVKASSATAHLLENNSLALVCDIFPILNKHRKKCTLFYMHLNNLGLQKKKVILMCQ